MLPLIDAERAWAYAMQLKSEANTEPRKRFHMISRLRKAVQHATMLDRLCNDSGVFDARTKLEVEVGHVCCNIAFLCTDAVGHIACEVLLEELKCHLSLTLNNTG